MAYISSDSLFLQHRHRAGWDWSIPTNAVPGVEDLPRRAPAPREEAPDRGPVFTLEGYGARGRTRPPKPSRLNTVPGPGEEPAGTPAGPVPGTGTASDQEWDLPPVVDEQAAARRSALLDRISRRLVELGTECLDTAHRAGSATKALCRELLARRLPKAKAVLSSGETQSLPTLDSDRFPGHTMTHRAPETGRQETGRQEVCRRRTEPASVAASRDCMDDEEGLLRPQF